MADLRDGGNEPPDSLKAIKVVTIVRITDSDVIFIIGIKDSRERDDDSDALRCADVCNEDLEDEELEVDDEEDERTRPSEDEQGLYNRHEYLHCAVEDSGGARRSTSPSAERDDCSVTDTEEAVVAASPPVVPKPLPHPGVTLGGLHQPAGAGGPPCWGFPHGLATQFAWMPVYRSASPTKDIVEKIARIVPNWPEINSCNNQYHSDTALELKLLCGKHYGKIIEVIDALDSTDSSAVAAVKSLPSEQLLEDILFIDSNFKIVSKSIILLESPKVQLSETLDNYSG
ncbi:hypothetical protein ANN_20071 [Periplaneta americana]|uniref:Uncharacterized protein n=1 Tax=Periplaneta americana TaxID=6978 RepID=A0ABQ8SBM9_PERAM|nr:hypothetical protein ANN_20071 [Periplaneta americana]